MPHSAAAAAPATTTASPQLVCVGKRSDFTEGSRQLVKCGVRNIAIICHRGTLYAIDNACYHHGGPLLRGDIEEMGGHPCIVCPWHSYKIALDTGEGLYMGIELGPNGGKPQQAVRSKGCKQRVHQVTVDDSDDVYVKVDLGGAKWESDVYASMELANREGAMRAPTEGDIAGCGGGSRGPGIHSSLGGLMGGGVRSGQVFQQMGLANFGRAGGLGAGGHGALQLSPGSSGLNPFDGTQKSKSPMGPPLLPGAAPELNPHRSGRRGISSRCASSASPPPNLFVACSNITEVCPGVREFDFVHHSGPLLRHAELGEYVELELPIKEVRENVWAATATGVHAKSDSSLSSSSLVLTAGDGGGTTRLMRRRWTICDVNRNGTLFTLIVKAAGTNPQASGSAWLHQRSLQTPLRVCAVGGTFTFADHANTARELKGNVLWLTAGIGISSAYAALNASLDDTFFVESSDPLHLVHLHANHTLDTVPKLSDFVRWQRAFPLSCNLPVNTAPPRKTYAMELFISPQKKNANDATPKRVDPPGFAASSSLPVTHRQHLHRDDVVRAVQTYFGSDLPLAYVCGPPSFVSDCADALLSAGLPESHILTDDPEY